MDTKEAGRRGGLAKWAKIKSKRKRSEIMREIRRGVKPNAADKQRGRSI